MGFKRWSGFHELKMMTDTSQTEVVLPEAMAQGRDTQVVLGKENVNNLS
jgi:hypothetical protein